MKVLDLRRKTIRSALEHPVIEGLRLINRGTFSAVYDKGDTILKVTIDRSFIELLKNAKNNYAALPRLVKDHGTIGMFRDKLPIRALEIEKLRIPKANNRNYRTAKQLCSITRKHIDDRWLATSRENFNYPDAIKLAMADVVKLRGVSPDVIRAMRYVARFTLNTSYGIDLHIKNIMERPSTGELVLSDPVADYDTYDFL